MGCYLKRFSLSSVILYEYVERMESGEKERKNVWIVGKREGILNDSLIRKCLKIIYHIILANY